MATLLVVEDDEVHRKMLDQILGERGEGHHLIFAKTLREGRGLLDSFQIDLVITDGLLPDGNGAPWAEELFTAGYKVLLVTGTPKSLRLFL